ncbi:MAG: moleuclar chaperone Hap20 [Geobacteraceae bacterium GWC2_58_44]|nr:MAG: moleuclar chaperone Hap20 [Geobacteraceae bacterium GWC2_58_44]HBG07847.1 Hsp20/alpha crystallin family protein [Geobacter sp.]
MLERERDLLRDRPQGQQEQVQRQQQDVQEGRSSSPFAQMDRLFDEVFKRPFFSLWSTRMGGEETEQQIYLPVDIFEDGESVNVRAELPGIRKEDVNVQLNLDSITISGKKFNEQRVQERDFYRLECSYGSFSRTCQLPAEIIVDKARAVFKDGILEVRIPKSMESTRLHSRKLTVE